jgi:hypothetical protein
MRAIYRFQNWHVRPDPTADPVYEGVCVTDEEECQWESGEQSTEEAVTKLIGGHARDSKHHAFKRTTTVMVTANPGEWL